ncbi:3'-5' exoribonuclease [Corynebacterium uropygiale]|uniref:3'-5' exoribonuclease n=1 Tax=Corynebacterium uropygiale TaxID=1775911 RepID=A0A9X1QMP3_9CORY|nr:3'-5' exoribonuclease [Corynebacterium uropygiale]
MQEFVALDFETANEQRCSACSVGLVAFDTNGEVSDRFDQILRPHPDVDYFNPVNTWVHGMTAADVADAPQWSDIKSAVDSFIGDRPLVAHNMAFDGFVLSDLNALYGCEDYPNRRYCTLRLARRLLADKLQRKSLDRLFDYYFPGDSFAHHDASSDAEVCGRIFARMQSQWGIDYLSELCPPTGSVRKRGSTSGRSVTKQGLEELITQYSNPEALAGETVVFTGTLQRGQRSVIQALVKELGGTPDKSLTKRTTILVVGIPNPGAFAEGATASRKLTKATQLRESGSPIQVMSEEEFFHRLEK